MTGGALRRASAMLVAALLMVGTGCVASKERTIISYTMAAGEALHDGDYERGIACLNRLIVLEPEALTHYFGLARAYEAIGHPDLAIAVYEEYMEAVPEMPSTQRTDIERRIEALKEKAEQSHRK